MCNVPNDFKHGATKKNTKHPLSKVGGELVVPRSGDFFHMGYEAQTWSSTFQAKLEYGKGGGKGGVERRETIVFERNFQSFQKCFVCYMWELSTCVQSACN